MISLRPYFLIIRPKTLPAALVPVAAGCLIVWQLTGTWSPRLAIWTALSALCIQIATNIFNDAVDSDKQADTKKRLGPKRITATGMMSRDSVYILGWIFILLASACALPLIAIGGIPIIVIGAFSLYFTYGYTGGILPLAYKGLGELFVFIFFGLVAVMGTAYLQGIESFLSLSKEAFLLGKIPPPDSTLSHILQTSLVVGMQCGLLSCVIIEINNIRDRREDEGTGKRTLAVRLGDVKARRFALGCLLATYILVPMSSKLLHLPLLNALWIPALIFALILGIRIKKTPATKKMNGLLAQASLHLIFFVITLWCVCKID